MKIKDSSFKKIYRNTTLPGLDPDLKWFQYSYSNGIGSYFLCKDDDVYGVVRYSQHTKKNYLMYLTKEGRSYYQSKFRHDYYAKIGSHEDPDVSRFIVELKVYNTHKDLFRLK